jgi:hypothetical protein
MKMKKLPSEANSLGNKGKLVWTDKAQHRFKEQVREITSRNRGHHGRTVIDELRL